MKRPLTTKQWRVLNFIIQFQNRNKYAPTLHEISDELSISVGAVRHHIKLIEKKGFLEYRGARAIKLYEI